MKTVLCNRLLRGGLALSVYVLLAGTAIAQQTLTPIRASEHVWYFQGDSGMASTANHAFNSNAAFIVTGDGGHGAASRDPAPDIALTRDYLQYLRKTMGQAVRDLVPFDEAYAAVDWSRFEKVPAFAPANRVNAYGAYLGMEQEALGPAGSR